MKKAFLLAFSNSLGTQEQVKNCLNQCQSVEKWRYDMLHSFYIISESDAKTIADEIRRLMQDKGRFIVVEINTDAVYGWLTSGSWYLINNKEYKKE